MYLKIPLYGVPDFHKDKNIARPKDWIPNGELWWESKRHPGLIIKTKFGRPTDFASIPPPANAAVPVAGRHRLPSHTHDNTYDNEGKFFLENGEPINLSKRECDLEYGDAMEFMNTDFLVKHLILKGLFVGGWTGWLKAKRKNKKKAKYFLEYGAEKYAEKFGVPSRAVLERVSSMAGK